MPAFLALLDHFSNVNFVYLINRVWRHAVRNRVLVCLETITAKASLLTYVLAWLLHTVLS